MYYSKFAIMNNQKRGIKAEKTKDKWQGMQLKIKSPPQRREMFQITA
jgi:hypothetical protein